MQETSERQEFFIKTLASSIAIDMDSAHRSPDLVERERNLNSACDKAYMLLEKAVSLRTEARIAIRNEAGSR